MSTFIALEAVVRNGSFTRAAQELRVTQAAVSQQVKSLEERLGARLIHRTRPKIQPTSEAELIAFAVRRGIDGIEQAVRPLLERRHAGRLSVAAVTALSSLWLMPRLPRFFASHPGIEVNLITRDREIQRGEVDFDLGILFTDEPRAGFDMRRLFGDELIAVSSPEYLGKRPSIMDTEGLLKADLLHLVTDDPWMGWIEWFASRGVPVDVDIHGPRFTNYILLVQAAVEGQGIALGWRRLVQPMLEAGQLVAVTNDVVVPEPAYHVIVPNERSAVPAVRAFRNWLIDQAAGDW